MWLVTGKYDRNGTYKTKSPSNLRARLSEALAL